MYTKVNQYETFSRIIFDLIILTSYFVQVVLLYTRKVVIYY